MGIEVWLPADRTGPVPVVMYIHGGGFTVGTHLLTEGSIGHALTVECARRGLALASVEYRLSPAARYPIPVQDVFGARRWLQDHGASVGVDGSNVAAIGHSAGGYFALMLATAPMGLDGVADAAELRVRACVAWSAPTDLAAMPVLGAVSVRNTRPEQSPEAQFLGAPPDRCPALAATASPITRVTADSAPLLMFQGTADDGTPLEQGRDMVSRYRACGADAALVELDGADHLFGNVDREAMITRSVAFLAGNLLASPSKPRER